MRSRRTLFAFGLAGALLVASVAAHLLSYRAGKRLRSSVTACFEAQVDGDDIPDVVVVYDPPDLDTLALVEAISPVDGRALWTNRVPRLTDTYSSGYLTHVTGAGRIALAHRAWSGEPSGAIQPDVLSVTVLRTDDGSLAWSYTFPDDQDEWGLYVRLWLEDDLLLTLTGNGSSCVLTAFDLDGGTRRWQADMPVFASGLFRFGGSLGLLDAAGLLLVDIETGTVRSVPSVRGFAVEHEGALLAAVAAGEGYGIAHIGGTGAAAPVLREDGAIVSLPEGANPYEAVGLYRDEALVALVGVRGKATEIHAVPLQEGAPAYAASMPEGTFIRLPIDDWRQYHRPSNALLENKARYLPFWLVIEGPPARWRLAVFDLEQGRLTWQSRTTAKDRSSFGTRPIIRRQGRHLIDLPLSTPGEPEPSALLLFDGVSGTFRAAMQIEDTDPKNPWRGTQHWMTPSRLTDTRLYGMSYNGRWWAIDLAGPALAAASSDTLVLRSAWEEVEAVLGPLPRDPPGEGRGSR